MQNKFKNGKIYKLVDNTNRNIYIGSTILSLKNRLKRHLSTFKRYTNGKSHKYLRSFEILTNLNFDIVLIENHPCCNFEELLIRENFYITTMICLNKNKAYINDEEKKNTIKNIEIIILIK